MPETRSRDEWEALERDGVCPECKHNPCTSMCRKFWFDYGYRVGAHDGANGIYDDRWDSAFLVEMIERNEVGK